MIGIRTVLRRARRLIGIRSHAMTPTSVDSEPIGTTPLVTRPNGERPRVVIFAGEPGWAHDAAALPLSKLLSDEFEIHIEYRLYKPDLSKWPFDLIYVLYWGEMYHHKYVHDARRIIKQVSSHRWEKKLTPNQFAAEYLVDAGTISVPSLRLQKALYPHRKAILAPKGIDPGLFSYHGQRTGKLRIGWAGGLTAAGKGVKDILIPAAGQDFELVIAGGELTKPEMANFYNSVDVICVASNAEGDPLPLLEGMACGCFPVCVDVGIVPEVVQNGSNGLIIERTPAAFRDAFAWCAAHLDQVRETGLRNADEMLRTRTWEIVSEQWRTVMRHAYRGLDDKASAKAGGAPSS